MSLIIRGLKGFRHGSVCDALIAQIDIFPITCDILKIEKPGWLEGESFLPVLEGRKDEINEELFAEVNYHASSEPKRAVRTRRWKYIKRYDNRRTAVIPNCDNGPSKSLWLDYGWQKEPLEREEELYDLIFDPCERNNLAIDPEYNQVLQQMRGRMERSMQATNDPLLHGPIALPPGVRTMDPNAISPADLGRRGASDVVYGHIE